MATISQSDLVKWDNVFTEVSAMLNDGGSVSIRTDEEENFVTKLEDHNNVIKLLVGNNANLDEWSIGINNAITEKQYNHQLKVITMAASKDLCLFVALAESEASKDQLNLYTNEMCGVWPFSGDTVVIRRVIDEEGGVEVCSWCNQPMNKDPGDIDWEMLGFSSQCDNCCCGACGGRKKYEGYECC